MKRMDLLRAIGCMFLGGSLLFSCSREEVSPLEGPSGGPLRVGVDTRAAGAVEQGTTFRIMAYGAEGSGRFGFRHSGTYYLKETAPAGGKAELTACSLFDNGTSPSDDASKGLNGVSGNYSLVFVSPGTKHNSDGSFSVSLAADKYLVASEAPETKTLGTYGLISMSKSLKEYRSTIGVEFYRKKDGTNNRIIAPFEITDLCLVGCGKASETVKVFPGSRQVVCDTIATRSVSLTDKRSENTSDPSGNPLLWTTDESNFVPVASGIYAPKDRVAGVLGCDSTALGNLQSGSYIYLKCTLTPTDQFTSVTRDSIHICVPLTKNLPELKPQCKYVFKVIVHHDYFTLSVDIFNGNNSTHGWETGGSEDENLIETPPAESGNLGAWTMNGWTSTELDDQQIEGSTNRES